MELEECAIFQTSKNKDDSFPSSRDIMQKLYFWFSIGGTRFTREPVRADRQAEGRGGWYLQHTRVVYGGVYPREMAIFKSDILRLRGMCSWLCFKGNISI